MTNQPFHSTNVTSFARLIPEDQAAFTRFFSNLTLSQSAEREFLEWLPEIAFTRKLTVSQLLRAPELIAVVENNNRNAPQKIAAIRDAVYNMRFPNYAKTLSTWKQLAAKTIKDKNAVQLSPSLYFEKDRLEIKIQITNGAMAKRVLENLATIDAKTWDQLISPSVPE